MTTHCADSVPAKTLASSQAHDNLAENRASIARSQGNLTIADAPGDVEWVFARDRALTFRNADGTWFNGCSLPRRAAAEMMRKVDVAGPVACFLAPLHAAQLRVALDRIRHEQAVIAIVPDPAQMPLLLSSDNFTVDIERHRLWFVIGNGWAQDLKALFAGHPGLCTPTQFIRLPAVDNEAIDALIPPAQKAFADTNADRLAGMRRLRETYTRRSQRLCVIAPSQFRLWDDAGHALAGLFSGDDALRIDLDDPTQASALALAQRSQDCGAIVAANIGRGDLPNVLSDSIPWITWASDTRIPSARAAAEHDRVIIANPKLAIAAGWPGNRVIEARWPVAEKIPAHGATYLLTPSPGTPGEGWGEGSPDQSSSPVSRQPNEPSPHPLPEYRERESERSADSLAMIVDTRPLDVPDHLAEFSSHRVLWEMIATHLHDDPFSLTDDVEGYLNRRMKKLDIAAETLPTARFICELILPAYQQGLARLLVRAKIPLRIFGREWDRLPEFAPYAGGIVGSREQFREIIGAHKVLVHVWTNPGPHAIDSMGKPVLRRRGSVANSFVSDARQLLTGRAVSPPISAPALIAETILKLVR